MPRTLLRSLITSLLALSAGSVGLHAQGGADAPSASRWTSFLGCWSTSSAGVIGPMVCVVPTDSAHRVEFLTVDRDSVLGRTTLDASGRYRAFTRGDCSGVERGRWSSDSTHVFIEADYRCGRGQTLRSDAVLDLTHLDAFSYVEGVSGGQDAVRTVNFMVQHDTLVFPAEVRRRLPAYRPLAMDVAILEAPVPVSASTIAEAATTMPYFVVDAWLANRGGSAAFALVDRDVQRAEARRRNRIASSIGRARYGASFEVTAGVSSFDNATPGNFFGQNERGAVPYGVLVTPAMVNFGRP